MKFLVIRFSSIGDIVLTTPVVRCLKRQVATAEVHYLTKKAFRPILEANPYIDKIHCLEDDLDALVRELRGEDFDYVIDLHHNLRTLRVKRALGKEAFSFDKLNIEKWWYTNFKWDRMPDRHIVDRYMDTVAGFGVRDDGAGLDYFIPASDELAPGDIPTSHQAGYVGVVIGAAHATKRLPFHKLKEICERVRYPLILLGGPEDVEVGERLAAIDPVRIYNSCGKFRLNESAALVKQARVVVTHDTGLMHIAAAFRRLVISVWGNTVPEFGMYPYYGPHYLENYRARAGRGEAAGGGGGARESGGEGAATRGGGGAAAAGPGGEGIVGAAGSGRGHGRAPGGVSGLLPYDMMEVDGLSCRPCSKIGYKKCPKGHFKCMEMQNVERLVEGVYKRLG